ncbi:MAG TPA: Glu-tRNA(Gln) amidotransferase subunit GatE [Candidatus Woesearchaeota archaeon]|nr:Glu-tRNA(Gln) amidotransferase subunit GatE [Candidatus Woesearchaeota archaeon]
MGKELKITCGVEIHQQLEGRKLFCNCPTIIKDGKPDYVVERKLRAVVGETGEVDVAAAQEARIGKKFIYECFDENVCLVDLDEAPPNELNEDVLNTALQVCKLLDATVVDEVQVMRKAVVDGSNTTGFQRTALVGLNGSLKTSKGVVSIPTIFVEEDSARTIKRSSDEVVYRLDRLGIPLFEISTGPDIHSAEHCAEVVEKIGLLLRSTGKCKRGIGTIRQDINVSVEGGARVEIKGAQDLKLVKSLVELEALRQSNLLDIKAELKLRKVRKSQPVIVDVSDLFRECDGKIVKSALSQGKKVLAIKLSGFAGLLGRELQPNKRLGTEFSNRAKVKAGVGGIFHSDELPAYGISDKEVAAVKDFFKCSDKDAFVLCADEEEKAKVALLAVIERANECLVGVPNEVRDANPDGTSTYLRPMPGSARLYPETDVPPIRISEEWFESVEVPELIEDKVVRFVKLGLSKDLAELIAKSPRAGIFDRFVKSFPKLKPSFIAETLATIERVVRREFKVEISPTEDDFDVLFSNIAEGKVDKSSVVDIFRQNKPVKDVISKFLLLSDSEVERIVKQIVDKNKGVPFNALMGLVMKELRGKASGEKVVKFLKKLVS